VVDDVQQLDAARRLLTPLAVGQVTVEEHTRTLTLPVTGGAPVLVEALRRLDGEQVVVSDVGLRRPTLDDVFLSLTGHAAEDDDQARQTDHTDEQAPRLEMEATP
jgi:ABC-2 type transport system ATP-binding protein